MAAQPRRGPSVGCAACAVTEARYHELVKELLAMKREGFTPAAVLPAPAPLPELDGAIRAAIKEIAPSGSPLARQQVRLAWDLLATGQDPAVVARMIRQGEEITL